MHYTTGAYDMFIKLYAENNSNLLQIIHDKLQPLGLSRSETIISFHEAINRQLPISKIIGEDTGEYAEDEEMQEETE